MQHVLFAAAMLAASSIASAKPVSALDVSDPVAYERAHRTVAVALQRDLATSGASRMIEDLVAHQRELPLRELCGTCDGAAKRAGVDEEFEPGVWLYQPSAASKRGGMEATLIAFPPAGDDRTWQTVDALTLDGQWVTLDAQTAPDVPVLVVRINGRLSFEKQIGLANAMLRDAGLQAPPMAQPKGTGRWTTKIDAIRLANDQEPWISGAAEIYAITSGVLPGNQPQVAIVDMPYLDHDGHDYYPNQIVLDWASFSYGVANIQFYEHDDNTNYKTLVSALVQAIGAIGSLAGYPAVQAVTEIASRIVDAMPDGWFSNDDDYVDSFYTVEKANGAVNRMGAAGNVRMTYVPYELPGN